jgi:hypothetical protein
MKSFTKSQTWFIIKRVADSLDWGNSIHFNLTDFGGSKINVWSAVQKGWAGAYNVPSNVTNWELFYTWNHPEVMARTTFYYQGQIVLNPFN